MTAAEVVHVQPAALEQLDPGSREAAVTAYLSHARDQLALAVQATGPEAVAALKAEIATAAEATKQLGLSKEIQTDAQEMVRRAEYALGKAIRAAQERGEISTRQGHAFNGNQHTGGVVQERNYTKVKDFFPEGGETLHQVMSLSNDITEPEFDAAIADAKVEGNLSRANVARKIKGVKAEGLSPVEKLVKVREMAPGGYTSGQIAREIGVGEEYVRRLARDNGIEITADKVMDRSKRRVDSNRIVQETASALEGLVIGIRLVNFDDIDVDQANDWATSLNDSIRALNRFVKQIREMTQ